jgi:predicted  nucleic acid-binding Zn-ribbon protein
MSEDMSELARRIRDLEAEERTLSSRRAHLQDRIDFLRSGGGGPAEDAQATLDDLMRRERELSERRRELHAEIETVRAELIRARR